jgi:O-6-methylguanine DNA methyltransferase
MLNEDDDTLYAALTARDPRYDGRAYVGVTSTGIFCRLTCPARTPKRDNTRFFASTDAALAAGFRPCKRCRPLAAAEAVPTGLDDLVDAAAPESGLRARWLDTPIGTMLAIADDAGIRLLEFAERRALPTEIARLRRLAGPVGCGDHPLLDRLAGELADYFAGRRATFDLPLAQPGSAFAARVWAALTEIPAGETTSYGQLAAKLGRPEAVRAVAGANGANQIAILVPCHRVIGADGSLTGYGGGLWRKSWLIEHERRMTQDDLFGRRTA